MRADHCAGGWPDRRGWLTVESIECSPTTERTATMSTDLTFLLVHGSWHDGSCWSAVAEQLGNVGFPSLTPTLPGHHAAGDRSHVTHDDYVRTVVAALDAAPSPVVLVGH